MPVSSSMWFVMGLCYVIGVFAYGFDGKLESAESGFPARLFLLPVRTWVLVGWPMATGRRVVAVLLWLAWDRLVLRPSGVETPAWWAAMLAAVVATSQALVWLPFGLPWLRLLVMIGTLTALVRAPAILAVAGERFTDPETQNSVLGAFAVAARSGLVPGRVGRGRSRSAWRRRGLVVARGDPFRSIAVPAPGLRPFSSAMRAQVWYEWRRGAADLW